MKKLFFVLSLMITFSILSDSADTFCSNFGSCSQDSLPDSDVCKECQPSSQSTKCDNCKSCKNCIESFQNCIQVTACKTDSLPNSNNCQQCKLNSNSQTCQNCTNCLSCLLLFINKEAGQLFTGQIVQNIFENQYVTTIENKTKANKKIEQLLRLTQANQQDRSTCENNGSCSSDSLPTSTTCTNCTFNSSSQKCISCRNCAQCLNHEVETRLSSKCSLFTDVKTLLLPKSVKTHICETGVSNCPSWFNEGTGNLNSYYLIGQYCTNQDFQNKVDEAVDKYYNTAPFEDLPSLAILDLIPIYTGELGEPLFNYTYATMSDDVNIQQYLLGPGFSFGNGFIGLNLNSNAKIFTKKVTPSSSIGTLKKGKEYTRSNQFNKYIAPLLKEVAPDFNWYKNNFIKNVKNQIGVSLVSPTSSTSLAYSPKPGLSFTGFSTQNIVDNFADHYFKKHLNHNIAGLSCIQTLQYKNGDCPWKINDCLNKNPAVVSAAKSFFNNKPDAVAYGFLTAFWNTIFSSWFAQYIKDHSSLKPETIYGIYRCAGYAANGAVTQFQKYFCGCSAHAWDSAKMLKLMQDAFNDKEFLIRFFKWIMTYYNGNHAMYWDLDAIATQLGLGAVLSYNGECPNSYKHICCPSDVSSVGKACTWCYRKSRTQDSQTVCEGQCTGGARCYAVN